MKQVSTMIKVLLHILLIKLIHLMIYWCGMMKIQMVKLCLMELIQKVLHFTIIMDNNSIRINCL
jgi:hypothetical protein